MLPYVLEKKLKTRRLDRLQMCQSALQQYRLAYHSSSSCFAQFCDFDLLLLKFCFIEGPYALRFFKIHIDCWTRGIWPCLIHFQKKKKITVIVFLKNKKASISKLGAFDHDSFILKKRKRNHLFLKYQGFQKSCTNLQTRGIQPCLIHFQKKKKRKRKKETRFPNIMHPFLN